MQLVAEILVPGAEGFEGVDDREVLEGMVIRLPPIMMVRIIVVAGWAPVVAVLVAAVAK